MRKILIALSTLALASTTAACGGDTGGGAFGTDRVAVHAQVKGEQVLFHVATRGKNSKAREFEVCWVDRCERKGAGTFANRKMTLVFDDADATVGGSYEITVTLVRRFARDGHATVKGTFRADGPGVSVRF